MSNWLVTSVWPLAKWIRSNLIFSQWKCSSPFKQDVGCSHSSQFGDAILFRTFGDCSLVRNLTPLMKVLVFVQLPSVNVITNKRATVCVGHGGGWVTVVNQWRRHYGTCTWLPHRFWPSKSNVPKAFKLQGSLRRLLEWKMDSIIVFFPNN